MAVFQYRGKSFYIDNKLKTQIDKKIIPALKKRDKDIVFGVDGKEGSGKSKFSDILGAYIASQTGAIYDLDCVCMTPMEFKNRIMRAKKFEVVIYDEAHRGMSSRRTMSEVNGILVDLMMEMRQKNLCVFIVLPSIFMLDRYVALFRIRGLFHIYEKRNVRGFWVYFNDKKVNLLYLLGKRFFNYNCITWPKFRGRFYNQYSVDEEAYRKKKAGVFNDEPKDFQNEQNEKYKAQRDYFIYCLVKKCHKSSKEVSNYSKEGDVPMESPIIRKIVLKIDDNKRKSVPVPDQNPYILTFNNQDDRVISKVDAEDLSSDIPSVD